jgi:protocatechuate 3,4-dioxygenase beta subunit
MSKATKDPSIPRTPLTRRDWLGIASRGVVGVVVSQALIDCTAGDLTAGTADTGAAGATASGTTAGGAACVLTAGLTEGPYFVDEKLLRSDIRTDPATGVLSQGVPLALTFNVSRVDSSACTPLTGAYLDVWHCDSTGTYSDVSGNGNGSGAAGRKFLRGYQITDAGGAVQFQTIYPGWYRGRAVHVHFKLRLFAGATKTYEFTSQFFFDEALTTRVHALSPYSAHGTRDTVNATDGIYGSLSAAEKAVLTLQATATAEGYAGVINLGVKVG